MVVAGWDLDAMASAQPQVMQAVAREPLEAMRSAQATTGMATLGVAISWWFQLGVAVFITSFSSSFSHSSFSPSSSSSLFFFQYFKLLQASWICLGGALSRNFGPEHADPARKFPLCARRSSGGHPGTEDKE